jgi:glycosyltransferase involved in cell wall biosynthesis
MTALRILIAHAQYRHRGGEDVVAADEAALLQAHGHEVLRYTRDNRDIDESKRFKTAMRTLWSKDTVTDVTQAIQAFRPDIVHVHNTFPAMSPSLYWAAARSGTPIVQTLHNFRLLCPQAMLLRNGSVCESCVGHVPWQAIVHRCYHQSLAQSAVVAGMLTMHRSLGTYKRKIARYIALNEFCRRKFIEGGLPANLMSVKPNFANVPAPDHKAPRRGALFVGRLSPEKGIDLLLAAIRLLPQSISFPEMRIIGEGPELARVQQQPGVKSLGWLEQAPLFDAMRESAYLVLPSVWYENSPRTLIEAFGCGLPVIASRLGALAELVDDGRTGLLFDPTSPADLAQKISWAETHPEAMRAMSFHARREFEAKYTPDRNYSRLVAIYRQALESVHTEVAA